MQSLVNENIAAEYLGLSPRTLQNWRVRGGGPLFVRISNRSIRYRLSDIQDWIEARIRRSTSDPGPDSSVVK
ncbi:MAG: helix-turn-helix domain-containing protein [Rhodospirillaceae bacterium]|nr:helix-turn-helix domain-containing protein [Rhodospirillaceae bacterium]